MADRLSASLQESALTLIAYADGEGQAAANIVKKEYFEPPYDRIAERLIDFRRKFKKPPGDAHLDDLFDDLLAKQELFKTIIFGMHEQAPHLNRVYTLSRLSAFIEHQLIKMAIYEAAEILQHDERAERVDEVKQVLVKATRAIATVFDPGVYLSNQNRVMAALDYRTDALKLGIKELDYYDLGPARKEVHMLIAPQNRGKTWWLDYVGKRALMQRDRVLHISLEMGEELTTLRYLQTLFAIAKRDEEIQQTIFKRDELGHVAKIEQRTVKPKLALTQSDIKKKMRGHLTNWGTRLENVLIKQFPTAQLSMGQFEAYLDMLELAEGFVPDTVIMDYPDLMAYEGEKREALGRIFEKFRGVMVQRNMRGVVVTQGNRGSATAKVVGEEHVAEDWSKMATVDVCLTYSQTPEERLRNLARLYVAKGRNDRSKFTVLISQSYDTGQFVLDSAMMVPRYWDILADSIGNKKVKVSDDD